MGLTCWSTEAPRPWRSGSRSWNGQPAISTTVMLKLVNTRFFGNVCADRGPDVGGAGVRAFDQFDDLPVYVVNSTFGGAEGFGNTCSNGGGISSIGVSWSSYNSLFSHNHAIGSGGNPPQNGAVGGGSGGAICNDGNTMTLSLFGTEISAHDDTPIVVTDSVIE